MAIKELFAVQAINLEVATNKNIHAGMAVGIDTTTGKAAKAARDGSTGPNNFQGIAADDTSRTDNTIILIDPVGANSLDGSGNFVANPNGYFAAAKRALADYQDETVSNVSDLVSGDTGWQGPRRGLGVFNVPGSKFILDKYTSSRTGGVVKDTASTASDGGSDTTGTLAIGDYLTYGYSTNAGYWVKVHASDTASKKILRVTAIGTDVVEVVLALATA